MKLFIRTLRAALAFSAAVTLAPAASAQECLPPDVLITMPPAKLSIAEFGICGRLEASYLAGLGMIQGGLTRFPDNVPAEYRYYLYIRAFLIADRRPGLTSAEAETAYLLSTLALLPDDSDRYQIYSSFILRKYFRRNAQSLDLAVAPLSEVILSFTPPQAITNEKELNCFIRADYPGFPVEKIIETPVYRECVQE